MHIKRATSGLSSPQNIITSPLNKERIGLGTNG
jgi:hypothetical protein